MIISSMKGFIFIGVWCVSAGVGIGTICYRKRSLMLDEFPKSLLSSLIEKKKHKSP